MGVMDYRIRAGASQPIDYTIDQSLRFEDGDTPYLSRTPSSAGNRKTWTFSFWVKRTDPAVNSTLFSAAHSNTSNPFALIQLRSNGRLRFSDYLNSTTTKAARETTRLLRDTASWYHVVLSVDTTQASASNRLKIYINGSEETSFSSSTDYAQDYESVINNAYSQAFGWYMPYNSTYYNDYLAEVHFIDGQALTPASFGETNSATNQWKPIEVTGLTYGTNGFYLDFSNSSSLGADASGNGNDFTSSGLAATDQVLDTPTNNFCVMNPLIKQTQAYTLSEGNLQCAYVGSGGGYPTQCIGTIPMITGKWYWEVYNKEINTSGWNQSELGIISLQAQNEYQLGLYGNKSNPGALWYYSHNGNWYASNGTGTHDQTSYGDTFTDGDIIGIAVNMDDSQITFYKNGVAQNYGTPINFSSMTAPTGIADGALPYTSIDQYTSDRKIMNFGQDSSFAGAVTAQGNTDGRYKGDFYYTPPSGYLALCSDNLSDPSIADPTVHMNTVTYAGTGASQTIAVGFQPDLVWAKCRNTAVSYVLYDSVRGTGRLESNNANAEGTRDGFAGFDSNGFDVDDDGGGGGINYPSGRTYVAWNWKAGGTAVSNTDGTITSSVSANTTAGFSIVSYAGSGSAGDTVGHGLSQTPDLIIIKNRSGITNWVVNSPSIDSTFTKWAMKLDISQAISTDSTIWNNTAPGASVFTLGTAGESNRNNPDNYMAYCFHSVEGYSKIGKYKGNGNADGTFIYTGFRPAFIIVKNTAQTEGWCQWDSGREPYNKMSKQLMPDDTRAEYTANTTTFAIDFVSNGVKLRSSYSALNNSNQDFLYIAFAESPFKTSNAR